MTIIENAVSTHTASKQWHRVPTEKNASSSHPNYASIAISADVLNIVPQAGSAHIKLDRTRESINILLEQNIGKNLSKANKRTCMHCEN